MTELGESIKRIDAVDKVTGRAVYPGDINLSGQLWMKTLFARRPHARIKRLDIVKAQAAPGVVQILTARDVPHNEYGLIVYDAPVLAQDIVRWVGEKVALVIAETEKQAEQARELIAVEYEDLPVLADPQDALKSGAWQVHPAYPGNLMKHIPIRMGDVARGFELADVIVESTYRTPSQEHAFLQPEAGMAYLDDQGRVTVAVAGQSAHEEQHQIAHALGLPVDQVRVIFPAIGGAFGGREDISIQIILALAAWKLKRPVKMIWTREESILGHHKRHAMWIKTKWGARKDGLLIVAEAQVISDAGPYAYTSTKVLGNATLNVTGPYRIPNVKVDGYAVVTNNVPGGAFRGFGGPQGHFASELQMDKIAEKLGMDSVELRLKNVLRENDLLSVQTPLPGGPVSLSHVIQKCADEFGWQSGPQRTSPQSPIARGRGFAAALKNVGYSFGYQETAWATVELHGKSEIDRVIVHHAGADVGQGAHTVMAQMAAHALGLPVDKVQLVASDTATSEFAGSSSASRMTWMSGHSIKGACEAALKKWQDEDRPAIATYQYVAPPTTDFEPETGKAKPNLAYGYVAEAVEAQVDLETGHVRVLRVTCVDDVGKAINRRLVEGQVEGAVIQAQGWTIQENFLTKDGRILTPNLNTYLIPGILDIPERVDSVLMEYPDENGPWGARGMAEMPFIPLAPAIVAAVHDATGVWFDEFPLIPSLVSRKLKTGE